MPHHFKGVGLHFKGVGIHFNGIPRHFKGVGLRFKGVAIHFKGHSLRFVLFAAPYWNPSRAKWARPSTNQWEVEATILGMSSSDLTGCRVPARSRIYGRLPSFKGRRASSKVPAFTSARKDDCSSASYTSCTETTTLEMSLTRASNIKGERNCRAGPPMYHLVCM